MRVVQTVYWSTSDATSFQGLLYKAPVLLAKIDDLRSNAAVKISFDPRYITVISACVIQGVMIGGFFAYGLFFAQLEEAFGWSRTLLSSANSVVVLVMGAAAIGVGRMNDNFGPRGIMIGAAIIYAVGWASLYWLAAPWQLFATFALCMGLGMSAHDVVTLSVIARCFAKRRGIMTGIVKVGTATGQILVPLAASLLIATYDWRIACLVIGAFALCALIAAALTVDAGLRHLPAHVTTTGSGVNADGIDFKTARRSRVFITLCVVQLCFFPTLITIPLHLPVHGIDLGLTTTGAATLLSTIGGASVVGRLFVGAATDAIGGRNAMLLSLTIITAALVLLNFASAPWALFVFACIYGIGHGGLFTVVSPTVAEYFGMRAHGSLFGIILFCGTLGAAFGPVAAGRAFDLNGSYSVAFWALTVAAGVALVLVATLPRSTTPTGR